MNIYKNNNDLTTFIELIPDLVFIKDYEGRYIHCNEVFLDFVNKKRVEVLNKTDFELFSKENANSFHEIDKRILDSNKKELFEEKFIHDDSSISYFETTKEPIHINDKQIGLFCIAKNITLKKEYEIIYNDNKKMLEYIAIENDLSKILDKIVHLAEERNLNVKCSILILGKNKQHLFKGAAPSLPSFYNDAIDGVKIGEKIGSCGSAAYKKERVIVEDINKHENWQAYLELTNKANLHACWSEPIFSSNNEILGTFAIYNNKPKSPSDFELRLINSYAHLASVAIEKINTQKLFIKKEKEQSTLLSLFEKGDEVILKWKNNSDWSVDYVSSSITKLLGYEKEDFLNGNINYSECIHKDDIKNVFEEVNNAIENNLDYFKHKRYRVITKNGEIKYVLDSTVTLKNTKGNITHFIGYITDFTDQQKQQEIIFQQSKMVSIVEMLGNISHQWRQPLSIITTLATGSIMEKELGILKEKDFYKNMETINEYAQYLSKIIDDFRNFIVQDEKAIDFSLSKSIDSYLTILSSLLEESNIKIIKDFDDSIVIHNYENNLKRALINITNNSIEAFKRNNIKEKYIFISTKKDKKNVVITIKDNAGGIDSNMIDSIFEPYTTSKFNSLGIGLGLNSAYNCIVNSNKGLISVKNSTFSYMGKILSGAEFTIHLK